MKTDSPDRHRHIEALCVFSFFLFFLSQKKVMSQCSEDQSSRNLITQYYSLLLSVLLP